MTGGQTDVEMIFNSALGRACPAERAAYLDDACGSDAELRARIEALLKAHEGAGSFLGAAAPDTRGSPDEMLMTREASSERIGRYKLLQLIGEGGFGSVYLAEQEAPVRRKVAIKIIKLGMDTKQVIARFEAERQALAMMDHLNIARVLDAGATETGRPYFVMELVKGVPITKYCDMNNLTTRERLDLFVPVCQAVQHAHQKGIIHRDIKPSNILVTLYDGKPVPKVIDFGIAKATHQRLTEKTLFTEFRQLVGTPEYMSPEQAEMSGLDIDTRSDIYSLGVLLYELLTGTTPFDPKTLREAAYREIQRIIREEEPVKPSTRFSKLGEVSVTIARHHHSDPSSLQRELRGDLDWITMKCLQKDRTRRYGGAAELGADIGRHLAHEPVVAGPPSTAYRMSKFVRRNRRLVASTVVVSVALIAAAVVSASFGLLATRARDLAETRLAQVEQAREQTMAERDRALKAEQLAEKRREEAESQRAEAEHQAAVARAVNEFLNNDLLASADPAKALGREVTVREVLDRASEAIGEKLGDKPLVEASIRTTLGETYVSLGEHKQAEPHLVRALELRRANLGEDHLDTLIAMSNLAILYGSLSRHEKAEPLLERALEQSHRVLGEEHAQTLLCMSNLARLYKTQGRYEEAEPLYVRALGLRRRTLGEEHAATLNVMNGLGVLYRRQGRYDEAEALYLRALEARRRLFGEQHPDTLNSMNNLATLYQRQGRYAEAEPLLEQTLESGQRVFGERHPATLSFMGNLAMLYQRQGRYSEAEQLASRTLELLRGALGDGHPKTLMSTNNLAALYMRMDRYEQAEPLFARALAVRRRVLGEEHPDTLTSMNNLAFSYKAQGRYEEAEPLYVRTLELSRRILGEEHPGTLTSMSNLAVLYENQGRYTLAEPLHLQTLELSRRLLGEEHPDTLKCMSNLAVLYERQGRAEEAKSLCLQTLELRRRVLGEEHPDTLVSMKGLGVLYEADGRYREAEPLFAALVAKARSSLPDGHWRTSLYLGDYGRLLAKMGRHTDAEAALLESHKGLAATLGPTHQRTIETIKSLVESYDASGKPDQAASWQAKLPTSPAATTKRQEEASADD